jgi:ParB family transcriptional regulator, chromosome partitioning protein
LALPDEAVLRVLTLVMAETLAAGSVLVEAIGATLKPDMARWWTADDTFLDLVRDRASVNAMLSEFAGQAVADASLLKTAKVQKKILRDCLEGQDRERIEGWVPRYMAFPVGGYQVDETIEIASAWQAVKPSFTGE